MSLEFFLILLVLALGGIIAPLGDRIGTKVGKARLSLFNLRPKKTAVLITILTGIVISASTMGLLLLVSRGIRDRLLNFDKIRRNFERDVETARVDLEKANTDKSKVETQLDDFKLERVRVKTQLNRINRSLKGAVERQRRTEARRQEVERQRNQIQSELMRVSAESRQLQTDIGRLSRDRQSLIQQRNQIAQQILQRDREISRRNQLVQQRDQEIKNRNQVILQRETRLKELEQQQVFLQTELAELAKIAQRSTQLRVGVPAIVRDQTLALAVVQAQGPSQARQAVDVVLNQANRLAAQRIRPGVTPANQRLIQIERLEIDRLLSRIADGTPYVLRVLSAGNYLLGENLTERRGVRVFIQVAPNRIIFKENAIVSAQVISNATAQTSDELQEWVTQLISQANFRAKQEGVWAQTSNVRFQSVQAVVEQLRQADQAVEVRVVTAADALTAGPLKLEFVVLQAGEVILQTGPER